MRYQKRSRISSSSAWYKRNPERWPESPRSRGAPELRLVPVSSVEDTRERERMSRRLSGVV
jgi:hypothetical protein